MTTLGNSTTTLTATGKSPGELHVFGPYTAASSGTVSQISVLWDGAGVGSNATPAVHVVYNDNSNTPVGGTLVVQSATTTVAKSQAKAYVDMAVATGSIVSGNKYWVGVLVSNVPSPDVSGELFYDNPGATPVAQCLASSVAWNSGTAPATFPAASFGPASTITVGAYLIYTVAVAGAGKNLTLLGVG